MKVFITGIAGFIGSALARSLHAEGHTVFGVDNLYSGYISNMDSETKWARADIRYLSELYEHLDDYDVVIHLAAQTSGEKSFVYPEYDMDTNLKGTYNIFSFAKECGSKLMINMSSMSVYGDVEHKATVDESRPPSPVSLYGNTKLAAENMLSALSRHDGLPVVSLRLFNAYGEGQDLSELRQGMISIYLAYFLYHDEVVVKGSFDRVRDFVYIDDIVAAISALMKQPKPESGVYNLSSGIPTSVGSVLDKIKEISGIDKNIVSRGNTAGDIMGFAGNNDKLCGLTGWKPKIGLEEGLGRMIKYYMERK